MWENSHLLVFVLKGSPVQAQDVIDDFQIQAFEAV